MSDFSSDVRTRAGHGSDAREPHRPSWETYYKRAPGLDLIDCKQEGTLLSLRPLMAMRLNAKGFALVSDLSVSERRNRRRVG